MSGNGEPAAAQLYGDVDVTDWTVVGDEVLATKPKRWLGGVVTLR